MNPIDILSVKLENTSLILSPYSNPINDANIVVSNRHNSATLFITDQKHSFTEENKYWKNIQGLDIWMPLLLARTLNKTAIFRTCIPYYAQFRQEHKYLGSDQLAFTVATKNVNLERVDINISFCKNYYADGSHLQANTFIKPLHFLDLYPHCQVQFAVLVPNNHKGNVDAKFSIIFGVVYMMYPFFVAFLRRQAQICATNVHSERTMQTLFFDTIQSVLGFPTPIRLTNRIDHLLQTFTLLLAILTNSTVSMYLLNMKLTSLQYQFSTVDDVIHSDLPIYAVDYAIGVPNLRWGMNADQIRYHNLSQIIDLMYEDGG